MPETENPKDTGPCLRHFVESASANPRPSCYDAIIATVMMFMIMMPVTFFLAMLLKLVPVVLLCSVLLSGPLSLQHSVAA